MNLPEWLTAAFDVAALPVALGLLAVSLLMWPRSRR